MDGAKEWFNGAGQGVRRIFIEQGHKDLIDFVENSPNVPHRLETLCRRMLRAHFEGNEQGLEQLPLPKLLIKQLTT